MQIPRRNGDNLPPIADIALAAAIVPRGQDSAIDADCHRMPVAAGNGGDSAPAVHVALALGVPAGCYHGAVGENSQRAPPAGGDSGDAAPSLHLALAIAVPSGGDDRAVGLEPHSVGLSRIGCRMHIPGSDRADRAPCGDVRLGLTPRAGGEGLPIAPACC